MSQKKPKRSKLLSPSLLEARDKFLEAFTKLVLEFFSGGISVETWITAEKYFWTLYVNPELSTATPESIDASLKKHATGKTRAQKSR